MNFDPNAFMQATIEGANSTRLIPWPVGDYHAHIVELKPKTGTIGKGERQGETWAGLDVLFQSDDPAINGALGRVPRSKLGIFLDLTEQGMLDMGEGKNLGLGRLREACGLNDKNRAFSPQQLIGQHLIINIGHRTDPNDPSIVYDEVKAVRKA